MQRRKRILDGYNRDKRKRHAQTELLVHLNNDAQTYIKQRGYHAGEHLDNTDYNVVYLPKGVSVDEAVDFLSVIPGVENVVLNHEFETTPEVVIPNDPKFSSQLTYMSNLDIESMWDLMSKYKGNIHQTIVSVVDTGFNINHEDLIGQFVLPGYNSAYQTDDVQEAPYYDQGAHGTSVVGVMIANSNNNIGVAGLALNSKCFPIRHCNDYGINSDLTIIRAINKVVEENIRVVNFSTYGSNSIAMQQSFNSAKDNGVIIFASAGNIGTHDHPNPMCMIPSVYGVSGIMSYGNYEVHPSSFYTQDTKFCTTFNTYTTNADNDYGWRMGTSFSSPIAASLSATMLSIDPSLTVDDVVSIMAENCIAETPPPGSQRYGYGVLQFAKTIQAVIHNVSTTGIFLNGLPIKQLKYGNQNIGAIYYAVEDGTLKKVWNPIAEETGVIYLVSEYGDPITSESGLRIQAERFS